jgi:hypothetical protein
MGRLRGAALTAIGEAEKKQVDAMVHNCPLYAMMERRVKPYTLVDLLQEAKLVCAIKRNCHIDRVASRQKRAMICWLVQYDAELLVLPQLRIESLKSQGRNTPPSLGSTAEACSCPSGNDAPSLPCEAPPGQTSDDPLWNDSYVDDEF